MLVMEQKKIPVILDGDPGHDDAIAWVLAKASPMLDILAVTSVCGNQTIQKTTYNAQRIRAVGNKVAVTVADWLAFFYQFHKTMDYPGAPIHDAVAVAALVKPEILTARKMYVDVETSGDYCMGCTVGDWFGTGGHAPNADVLLDIDREAFVDLLVEAVAAYGEGK